MTRNEPLFHLEWRYICERCGFTSVSSRPDLERCTARFADVGECGGELGDAFAYHWQLVAAGLLDGADDA